LTAGNRFGYYEFLLLCIDYEDTRFAAPEATLELYNLFASSDNGNLTVGRLQKLLNEKTLTAKRIKDPLRIENMIEELSPSKPKRLHKRAHSRTSESTHSTLSGSFFKCTTPIKKMKMSFAT
jgi:hypothetical protein